MDTMINDPLRPNLSSRLSQQDLVNKGLLAIWMAPMGITKAKTAYELAHEVAQRKATKMLGLPKGNTAMDRAKAMGYDTPGYHATPEDWISPDMSKSVRSAYGKGLHSGADPELANVFARQSNQSQVMPLMLRKGKTADASVYKKYADELGYDDMGKVTEAMRKDGYETVQYSHGKFYYPKDGKLAESAAGQDLAYSSLEPKNVRSRFAAFDPARAHESDLLAGLAPYLGVGGLLSLGLITPEEAQAK
jgi:hypothetical protein